MQNKIMQESKLHHHLQHHWNLLRGHVKAFSENANEIKPDEGQQKVLKNLHKAR
jgi:hypothetical protein